MEKGNVLIIGNSGVGKSTLINAVIGKNEAETGWGIQGTTKKLGVYESDDEKVSFRIIDSKGFEPSLIKQFLAIQKIKKWSKDSLKGKQPDNEIDLIWFCVDGQSSKLFPEDIKRLFLATKYWKSVPVIAVITKSYSPADREQNISMVKAAFAQSRHSFNLKGDPIPVVAALKDFGDHYVAPSGISELIDKTNEYLPEGKRAAKEDINRYVLSRKRVLAQTVVVSVTTAASAIGAIPIPVPDSPALTAMETGEISAIAGIYGIEKGEGSKRFFKSMVEAGTVGTAAKTLIKTVKAIPGLTVGASVLDAVIAGVFAASLGEAAIYSFEQVYLGNKDLDDIDWMKKIVESKLSGPWIEKLTKSLSQQTSPDGEISVKKLVDDLFKK